MSAPAVATGSYCAPSWLRGGHAQTIYPYLLPYPKVHFRRERVTTPDGDFWDFDWVDSAAPTPSSTRAPTSSSSPSTLLTSTTAPLVVLFHGLEGGSGSHYSRTLMAHLAAIGWRGVVAHFRGCSGELNRHPRAYHSGDYEEIGAMLDAIEHRVGQGIAASKVFAVGVSLGGSALLNWLGRQRDRAFSLLAAAAAVSAPIDLASCGIAIGQGFNRIYSRHFLATLRPKSLAIAQRFPGLLADARRLRRVRSMYEFDDLVTAPLHGFAGTDDYWRRASSRRWLRQIELPTLVLNACNDPFVPERSLPGPDEVSAAIQLEQPKHGGHVGFLSGPFPGKLDWLPRRLVQFFAARL